MKLERMTTMKKALLIGLTSMALSAQGWAGSVTAGVDTTTFTSGTSAVASEVNANFQALIDAINDNNDRIAALEAAATTTDVSGKTYLFRDLGIILAAHKYGQTTTTTDQADSVPSGFSRVGYFTGNFTIEFSGVDNTYTLSGDDVDVEMFTNADSNIATFNDLDFVETGTWSQIGTQVTLTSDGPDSEDFVLDVAVGAHVLTVANTGGPWVTDLQFNDGNGDIYQHEYEVNLGVGVLQPTVPAP